jgi:murein DD-endopeptidase MepM/ murein hydrolase activator NlpD
MRYFSRTIWLRAAACGAALLALCAAASPQRHSHRHGQSSRSSVSAEQAQAASANKVQLRQKLYGLRGHIHRARARVHAAKVQEYAITENIETVEARIARTRRHIAAVNARLGELATRHVQIVRRLNATQDRLHWRQRLLARRIRDNYQRGQATYAQVLLQSRSVHDLLSRGYYVRQVVHSDAELIQGVREDLRQVEADRRLLEQQTREQQALAADFEAQKRQFAADLGRKQELLQGAKEQRAEAENELDDLEAEANAMTDRIRILSEMLERRREALRREQEQRRHEEALRRRQQQEGPPPDEGDSAPPVWNGGFIRPTQGRITSGFGYRYHPILHYRRMHTGVDFGAPYGAPIRAAGGGTVIFAQPTRGYGNCVILDHGNGVTTLYGHCSALLVSEGQVVAQGQIIARVGATGMATGPHLHFEVRHDGVPVQPPF